MSETPEGIGGRKFSLLQEQDVDGAIVGPLQLMQGKTVLARLTQEGAELKHLLVTTTQLWEAANAFVLRAAGDAGVEHVEEFQRLKNMIAKSVNKDDWKQVLQS